jgi:hypothetical protein
MAIPGNFLSPTAESVDPNTSGWVAKANCAISLGTGGRNGDGTLRLTSAAAGEMQARTVAAYAVTAGTEYQAFADAAGATMPERIGIRWLNASSAEISITWSLVTSAASSSWHRISVAGVAPAGATQAHVVVSVMTPAAAGVVSNFENVYLGLPVRTTGNMLSFNSESVEKDATGWVVDTNCTISRQVPAVTWNADWYWAGGHTLAMTVSANGNAAIRSAERPAATPGTEYVGYAYLNPPTAGSTTWVELRFYDAALAQISATQATLAAPGTGWYRQRVAAFAPASTAYVGLAIGITGATAGQVVRAETAVIQVATPLREGSVVPYADASFEQGVGGWTVASGVATIARLTPWGTDALEGSYSLAVSSATATTSVLRSPRYAIGTAAGLSFTVEVGSKVTAGGWTVNRGIRWYDAANNDLGLTASGTGAVPTPNWWLLSTSQTAPAGATQAAIEWTLTATSASSVIRLDKASLWQALPLVEITANDTDAYMTVAMRELTGTTITVWRVTPDGARTLVRGSDGLLDGAPLTSDTILIEDYEAPLGVPVYYYAEARDSTGALVSSRSTAALTLDPGSVQYAWLKDPGQPQRNLRLMVRQAPDWQRAITQAEHRIRGARNPVVLSDVRSGLVGELAVYTLSDDERQHLHWLLDSGNVLLWQAAPGMGVDDTYVTVGAVTEARGGGLAQNQLRIWSLPLTQVDMPTTVGVAGSAGRTWQDVLSENATWDEVLSTYATWEDVLLNRPIGG